MKAFEYTITDPVGMHARPAGQLAMAVKGCASVVTVAKGVKEANALKMMRLMGLGIRQGDTVRVTVEGPDEEQAKEAIEAFFRENL